jgi:hypothetical protein
MKGYPVVERFFVFFGALCSHLEKKYEADTSASFVL